MNYYYHTDDKNKQLAYPHYSDETFAASGGAIIFGQERKGLRWEYDDRLRQWEPEKHANAWALVVNQCGIKRTAARIEKYLQAYYDDEKLELVAIIAGARRDNGYAWYAYGFHTKED